MNAPEFPTQLISVEGGIAVLDPATGTTTIKPSDPPAPKPGWKATEFYAAVGVILSGVAGLGWLTTHQAESIAAAIPAAVTAAGLIWAIVRTFQSYNTGRVQQKLPPS